VVFLVIVFTINFIIIFRGLSKGIEWFCKYAMPALIILALIILVRVLTLGTPDPTRPELNIVNGLGNMWNPEKVLLQELVEPPTPNATPVWTNVVELVGADVIAAKRAEIADDPGQRIEVRTIWDQLRNAQLWLAAAGQIFFSLSVGFGVIITYSSYLSNKDDVVLSGLTATSANEFCEVALGGLITVPAAFVFLGAAGIAGQGTFGLGFNVLPLVFSQMPFGSFFGFAFFFLLFLAAITSSLSMLQPGIAFLEEGLGLNRKQSVALLGMVTALGCLFVVYFSKDIKALDTIDFWVGTLLIYVLATILIILFGWGMGIEKGWQEAHRGALIRIPGFFKFIIKYVSPVFLLTIFVMWIYGNLFTRDSETGALQPGKYVAELIGTESVPANVDAQVSFGLILIVIVFILILISVAGRRWDAANNTTRKETK
jgi:SNF family Na+-dependent transporter